MKFIFSSLLMVSMLSGCAQSQANEAPLETTSTSETYSSIYWSDGDSGRFGQLKFRLANIDAPETGSMKQRGGAKCESERKLGYEAKAYIVEFTKGKTIVRRHIKWHGFRPRLRETLLTSLVDIKRRLCGIASVDVR